MARKTSGRSEVELRAEARIEQAQKNATAIFEQAGKREAHHTDSGFFSRDSNGTGGFSWFANREEMLDAIGTHLAYFSGDDVDVAERVASVVNSVRTDQSNLELVRTGINEALGQSAEIEWWGTFDSLLAGSSDFERTTRSWFRDRDRLSNATMNDGNPISREEVQTFRDAVREYGR